MLRGEWRRFVYRCREESPAALVADALADFEASVLPSGQRAWWVGGGRRAWGERLAALRFPSDARAADCVPSFALLLIQARGGREPEEQEEGRSQHIECSMTQNEYTNRKLSSLVHISQFISFSNSSLRLLPFRLLLAALHLLSHVLAEARGRGRRLVPPRSHQARVFSALLATPPSFLPPRRCVSVNLLLRVPFSTEFSLKVVHLYLYSRLLLSSSVEAQAVNDVVPAPFLLLFYYSESQVGSQARGPHPEGGRSEQRRQRGIVCL